MWSPVRVGDSFEGDRGKLGKGLDVGLKVDIEPDSKVVCLFQVSNSVLGGIDVVLGWRILLFSKH